MAPSASTPAPASVVGVTKAMEEAEAKLQAASEKERQKEMQRIRDEEFTKSIAQARFNRLSHLLDKTSLYSNFLVNRIEQQRSKDLKRKPDDSAADAKKTKSPRKKRRGTKADETAVVDTTEPTPTPTPAPGGTPSATATGGDGSGDGAPDTDAKKELSEADIKKRQPKLVTGGTLRSYQMQGVEWLVSLWQNGLNGILGDEMGLGKTLQCIAFVCHMIEHGVKGPYLIVAPLSTLPNWVNEFNRFCPDVPAMLYHGSPAVRKQKRSELNKGPRPVNTRKGKKLECFPVVITSYEVVLRDREVLSNHRWQYVIVDEGHRLKNMNCKLIKELKRYPNVNRLLLTGTPLQNNLSELWSLLNFLLPDIFDDLESFQNWFDFSELSTSGDDRSFIEQEEREGVLHKLHNILKPFLLRRLKTQVAKYLPKKKEIVIWANTSPLQKRYYEACLNKTLRQVVSEVSTPSQPATPTPASTPASTPVSTSKTGSTSATADATIDATTDAASSAGMTDPDTSPSGRGRSKRVRGAQYSELSEKDFVQAYEAAEARMKRGDALGDDTPDDDGTAKPLGNEVHLSLNNIVMALRRVCNHPYMINYPCLESGAYQVDEAVVSESGKLTILDQLLPPLLAQGRKVLIFSQMTQLLDILHDYLFLRDIDYCRLDGSTSYEERASQIAAFDAPDGPSVFLLSTRAGGLGINLVAADTVILYDSDWNPQVDLQAMDRAHRLGQKNPVLVYRLVTKDSVEETIFRAATKKRKLEKLVIHKEKFKEMTAVTPKALASQMTAAEMRRILASDESHTTMGGDITRLKDADLDALLDRSPRAFDPAYISDSTAFTVNPSQNDDPGAAVV